MLDSFVDFFFFILKRNQCSKNKFEGLAQEQEWRSCRGKAGNFIPFLFPNSRSWSFVRGRQFAIHCPRPLPLSGVFAFNDMTLTEMSISNFSLNMPSNPYLRNEKQG